MNLQRPFIFQIGALLDRDFGVLPIDSCPNYINQLASHTNFRIRSNDLEEYSHRACLPIS